MTFCYPHLDFHMPRECEFLMLVILSRVHWTSSLNRMRNCDCSHSQNYIWGDLPVRGVVLIGGDTDRNHHGREVSIPVSVLHQSSWTLCVYLLGLASSECCHSHSVSCGKEPAFLKVLCGFLNGFHCGILLSGYLCQYSTTAALPFPLQKLYTKCISAYSPYINVLGILTAVTLQHNSATLA